MKHAAFWATPSQNLVVKGTAPGRLHGRLQVIALQHHGQHDIQHARRASPLMNAPAFHDMRTKASCFKQQVTRAGIGMCKVREVANMSTHAPAPTSLVARCGLCGSGKYEHLPEPVRDCENKERSCASSAHHMNAQESLGLSNPRAFTGVHACDLLLRCGPTPSMRLSSSLTADHTTLLPDSSAPGMMQKFDPLSPQRHPSLDRRPGAPLHADGGVSSVPCKPVAAVSRR
eukprot:352068-Chlamydomonas_euryale.AAC.9